MSAKASASRSSSTLRPQSLVGSKYRLEKPLADGGMGTVWLATNVVLGSQVALKVLHQHLVDNELAGARLLREARAAAQIEHRNIVRVFDFGYTETGEPFIVMELLHGEDLATRLERVGRLSAPQAVRLLLPVTAALAAAHAKGIVHRDLKPKNIFLIVDDLEQLVPKVVDFGIAKVHSPEHSPRLTIEGRVVGSPEYLSPEQAKGEEDIDSRTDIWAFCVTLYESITGELPFHEANYHRLLRRIIEEDPLPTTRWAAGDEALWAIVEKGLKKARADRWQSMSQLGAELYEWLVQRHTETRRWVMERSKTQGGYDVSRTLPPISKGDGPLLSGPARPLTGADPTPVEGSERAPALGPAVTSELVPAPSPTPAPALVPVPQGWTPAVPIGVPSPEPPSAAPRSTQPLWLAPQPEASESSGRITLPDGRRRKRQRWRMGLLLAVSGLAFSLTSLWLFQGSLWHRASMAASSAVASVLPEPSSVSPSPSAAPSAVASVSIVPSASAAPPASSSASVPKPPTKRQRPRSSVPMPLPTEPNF